MPTAADHSLPNFVTMFRTILFSAAILFSVVSGFAQDAKIHNLPLLQVTLSDDSVYIENRNIILFNPSLQKVSNVRVINPDGETIWVGHIERQSYAAIRQPVLFDHYIICINEKRYIVRR